MTELKRFTAVSLKKPLFFILIFMGFSMTCKQIHRPTDLDEDTMLSSGLSGRNSLMHQSAVAKSLRAYMRGIPQIQVKKLSELITTLSRRYSLNPRLILAVIRVESRFQPWAVSPKGALGLMQIMPETGEWLARICRIEWKGPLMLFDPEVNVTLGVRYLAYLRDRYRGDVQAFLSAFNAGPSNFEKRIVLGKPTRPEYYHRVLAFVMSRTFLTGTDIL